MRSAMRMLSMLIGVCAGPTAATAQRWSPAIDQAFAKIQRDGKPYPAFYCVKPNT